MQQQVAGPSAHAEQCTGAAPSSRRSALDAPQPQGLCRNHGGARRARTPAEARRPTQGGAAATAAEHAADRGAERTSCGSLPTGSHGQAAAEAEVSPHRAHSARPGPSRRRTDASSKPGCQGQVPGRTAGVSGRKAREGGTGGMLSVRDADTDGGREGHRWRPGRPQASRRPHLPPSRRFAAHMRPSGLPAVTAPTVARGHSRMGGSRKGPSMRQQITNQRRAQLDFTQTGSGTDHANNTALLPSLPSEHGDLTKRSDEVGLLLRPPTSAPEQTVVSCGNLRRCANSEMRT